MLSVLGGQVRNYILNGAQPFSGDGFSDEEGGSGSKSPNNDGLQGGTAWFGTREAAFDIAKNAQSYQGYGSGPGQSRPGAVQNHIREEGYEASGDVGAGNRYGALEGPFGVWLF